EDALHPVRALDDAIVAGGAQTQVAPVVRVLNGRVAGRAGARVERGPEVVARPVGGKVGPIVVVALRRGGGPGVWGHGGHRGATRSRRDRRQPSPALESRCGNETPSCLVGGLLFGRSIPRPPQKSQVWEFSMRKNW